MAERRPHQAAGASALAAAHHDLLRRCHLAERAGDWQEGVILSALADVADYLKRIGDNPGSSHYRAEKAGALLTAAIRLHRDALLAYGGWPDDDDNERAAVQLPAPRGRLGASRAVDVAGHACGPRRHPAPNRSETDNLVHVGRQLERWARRQNPERRAEGIGI